MIPSHPPPRSRHHHRSTTTHPPPFQPRNPSAPRTRTETYPESCQRWAPEPPTSEPVEHPQTPQPHRVAKKNFCGSNGDRIPSSPQHQIVSCSLSRSRSLLRQRPSSFSRHADAATARGRRPMDTRARRSSGTLPSRHHPLQLCRCWRAVYDTIVDGLAALSIKGELLAR